jgi:hypothetical protein
MADPPVSSRLRSPPILSTAYGGLRFVLSLFGRRPPGLPPTPCTKRAINQVLERPTHAPMMSSTPRLAKLDSPTRVKRSPTSKSIGH